VGWQWALVVLQIVIAGAFFFEAGVLWARTQSKVEVSAITQSRA
jgi:hypothetical protein